MSYIMNNHHNISYRLERNGKVDIPRIWTVFSTISHGLLAGLALAHLLFVISININEWSGNIPTMLPVTSNDIEIQEQSQPIPPNTRNNLSTSKVATFSVPTFPSVIYDHPNLFSHQLNNLTNSPSLSNKQFHNKSNKYDKANNSNYDTTKDNRVFILQAAYLTFATIYLKVFYCLTVICILSVLDR